MLTGELFLFQVQRCCGRGSCRSGNLGQRLEEHGLRLLGAALLGLCRIHSGLEAGELVGERLGFSVTGGVRKHVIELLARFGRQTGELVSLTSVLGAVAGEEEGEQAVGVDCLPADDLALPEHGLFHAKDCAAYGRVFQSIDSSIEVVRELGNECRVVSNALCVLLGGDVGSFERGAPIWELRYFGEKNLPAAVC